MTFKRTFASTLALATGFAGGALADDVEQQVDFAV